MANQKDNSLRTTLDKANPTTLADAMRLIALGSLLQGQLPQVRRGVSMDAAGASLYNLSTLDTLVLPDGGKASAIIRANQRGVGELTIVAYGVTPQATQIAVAPNGNIVTLAADSVTGLDVVYMPERGDTVELYMPVVANVLTLPAWVTSRNVVLVTEAESLAGTLTGKFRTLVPAAANATSGAACLNLAKTTIIFAVADAVTRARVKLLIGTTEDLCARLESTTTLI